MGRRRPGKYPYDYTVGDDRRFANSGVGGTSRVLHGPGRGMGITEGVICQVQVLDGDGALLDAAEAGKLGKEHRLRGTVPGDRVDVTVSAHHGADADGELTATRTVVLTGDLDDVVRFGVAPLGAGGRGGRRRAALGTGHADGGPLGCGSPAPGGAAGVTALIVRPTGP